MKKNPTFNGLCGETVTLLSEDPFVPDAITIEGCGIEADQSISSLEGAEAVCQACPKKVEKPVRVVVVEKTTGGEVAAAAEKPRKIKPVVDVNVFEVAGKVSALLAPLPVATREQVLRWVTQSLS